MASKKSWGLIIALLLFLLPVGVCAQETEGQIFVLSAERLEALMDTALSRGIVFDERGMVLAPGEESGEYVSHAVEMAEFTMIAGMMPAESPTKAWHSDALSKQLKG